ncbi:MAG: hypothetical protein ACOCYT_05590, partial [Chloroflexota bacterium]
VMNAEIEWERTAFDDQWGFVFRWVGQGAYLITLDRNGNVFFYSRSSQSETVLLASRERNRPFGNGMPVNLSLVAIADEFILLIDGVVVQRFSDDSKRVGIVGIAGLKGNRDGIGYCHYSDVWTWYIDS